MSAFSTIHMMPTKLHPTVAKFKPRGGSSIVEVNNRVVIFGGADREQTHFQDIAIYDRTVDGKVFHCEAVTGKTSGDVPMPRSGHATCAFGKYMLLFGGIDFKEEAVFNDLYILDTETLEWSYVGEAGAEVIERNSHSMGIVQSGSDLYLVVYGGAHPEHGPLGDTFYAKLPAIVAVGEGGGEIETIDPKTFYVTWELLKSVDSVSADGTLYTAEQNEKASGTASDPLVLDITSHLHAAVQVSVDKATAAAASATCAASDDTTNAGTSRKEAAAPASTACTSSPVVEQQQPGKREMHATYCFNGAMYICGGRDAEGNILQDTWRLRELTSSSSGSSSSKPSFGWERVQYLDLPTARCAHGFAITLSKNSSVCQGLNEVAAAAAASTTTPASASVKDEEAEIVAVCFHIFGGFTGGGIDGSLTTAVVNESQLMLTAASDASSVRVSWNVLSSRAKANPPERFGGCLCGISAQMGLSFVNHSKYKPLFSAANAEAITQRASEMLAVPSAAASDTAAAGDSQSVPAVFLLLFGGVNAECDFGDIWLLAI